MLYRLFLLWQRDERRVIIIDGRSKPNATVLANAQYAKIGALAATVSGDPPPFAVADDFAREMLG